MSKEDNEYAGMTSPGPSKGGELGLVDLDNLSGVLEKGSKLPGYVTANLHNYKYLKEIRTSLKANCTDAEKLIWKYLQRKQTGHKIRRQHVIDDFITDFVCLSKKVVIEKMVEFTSNKKNTMNFEQIL